MSSATFAFRSGCLTPPNGWLPVVDSYKSPAAAGKETNENESTVDANLGKRNKGKMVPFCLGWSCLE